MITIDELIAEKGEMELAILKAVNEIKRDFEKKTGAIIYDLTFQTVIALEYNMDFAIQVFTDCNSKIAYKGVRIEEMP